jgi:hypothetical protein
VWNQVPLDPSRSYEDTERAADDLLAKAYSSHTIENLVDQRKRQKEICEAEVISFLDREDLMDLPEVYLEWHGWSKRALAYFNQKYEQWREDEPYDHTLGDIDLDE